MSAPCFGDQYFTTRDRLSQLMRGISRLAHETSATLDPPLPLGGESAEHDSPFLFIACGEINSGKSAFLNGLLDEPLCPVSDLPQTQPIRHYRHGKSATDDTLGPQLVECRRPLEKLRRHEVVDTPGIRSEEDVHLGELSPILERADLVFCILPVTNPWAAATWNFLSRLPASVHGKVVIIVQQSDQRAAEDLRVTQEHLQDLARKKLDFEPPIFAVSAHAKLAGGQAHGFDPLTVFINGHIDKLESRRATLRSWLDHAGAALDTVEDRIEDQARRLRDQNHSIEEIEKEIDGMRESFIRRLPHHLVEVAETFEKEADWVSRLLRRKLGATRSILRLFSGDRTGSQMESLFIGRIQNAVEAVAQKDSDEVVDSCLKHWQQLERRVLETFGLKLTATHPIGETLDASRTSFIKRLHHAAELGINNLKVRHLLDKELRIRNLALKSFTAMTLIFTLAGALCGALAVPWAPWILIGIGGLFLTGATLTAWTTRRTIVRDLKERLLDTCGAFAHTMDADFEEALRVVFKDYLDALSQVRDHLAREGLAIEPRQRKWQELFLTLKTIEQDL